MINKEGLKEVIIASFEDEIREVFLYEELSLIFKAYEPKSLDIPPKLAKLLIKALDYIEQIEK